MRMSTRKNAEVNRSPKQSRKGRTRGSPSLKRQVLDPFSGTEKQQSKAIHHEVTQPCIQPSSALLSSHRPAFPKAPHFRLRRLASVHLSTHTSPHMDILCSHCRAPLICTPEVECWCNATLSAPARTREQSRRRLPLPHLPRCARGRIQTRPHPANVRVARSWFVLPYPQS